MMNQNSQYDDLSLTTTDYTQALQPKLFDCCGWILHPFCLGHYILLEKLKSPVVIANLQPPDENTIQLPKEEQYEKLVNFFTAVMICTMDYDLADKALHDDGLLEKTSREFTRILLHQMEQPNWNYVREFYAFKLYLKYYFNIPPFDTLYESQRTPSGTDWKQNICVLFRKLGYKDKPGQREILNMPFNRLFMEWTSEAEALGGIKVWNSEEWRQINHPSQVVMTTKEKK